MVNRTVKEQFESEVKANDDLLKLDELNAFFEAWLSERYHTDIHSETGEAPKDRFIGTKPRLRNPPKLSIIEELLRLRYQRKVHKRHDHHRLKQPMERKQTPSHCSDLTTRKRLEPSSAR